MIDVSPSDENGPATRDSMDQRMCSFAHHLGPLPIGLADSINHSLEWISGLNDTNALICLIACLHLNYRPK